MNCAVEVLAAAFGNNSFYHEGHEGPESKKAQHAAPLRCKFFFAPFALFAVNHPNLPLCDPCALCGHTLLPIPNFESFAFYAANPFLLPLVQLLDKPALVQLGDKAGVDELLGLVRADLGAAERRDLVDRIEIFGDRIGR